MQGYLLRVYHMIPDILIQFQWITIPGIFQYVQCKGNDLIFLHAFSQETFPIQLKQQYRFAASAKSCDDLNTSITLLRDYLFQILLSRIHLCTSRFICGYPHFFHVQYSTLSSSKSMKFMIFLRISAFFYQNAGCIVLGSYILNFQ